MNFLVLALLPFPVFQMANQTARIVRPPGVRDDAVVLLLRLGRPARPGRRSVAGAADDDRMRADENEFLRAVKRCWPAELDEIERPANRCKIVSRTLRTVCHTVPYLHPLAAIDARGHRPLASIARRTPPSRHGVRSAGQRRCPSGKRAVMFKVQQVETMHRSRTSAHRTTADQVRVPARPDEPAPTHRRFERGHAGSTSGQHDDDPATKTNGPRGVARGLPSWATREASTSSTHLEPLVTAHRRERVARFVPSQCRRGAHTHWWCAPGSHRRRRCGRRLSHEDKHHRADV